MSNCERCGVEDSNSNYVDKQSDGSWLCEHCMGLDIGEVAWAMPKMTDCKHRKVARACITCGRTPERHKPSCLCQDFQVICVKCKMRVWVPSLP